MLTTKYTGHFGEISEIEYDTAWDLYVKLLDLSMINSLTANHYLTARKKILSNDKGDIRDIITVITESYEQLEQINHVEGNLNQLGTH